MPKVTLQKRTTNYFNNAILLWNKISPFLFEKINHILIRELYVYIPCSKPDSDLTIKSNSVKTKIKTIMLNLQCQGYSKEWNPRNFDVNAYNSKTWTWGI